MRAPGPLAELSGAPVPTATRTVNTNQASVFKLEFNTGAQLFEQPGIGAVNNAFWLRQGIRESVPRTATPPLFGLWPYLMLRSVLDPQQTPVDVGEDFVGDLLNLAR